MRSSSPKGPSILPLLLPKSRRPPCIGAVACSPCIPPPPRGAISELARLLKKIGMVKRTGGRLNECGAMACSEDATRENKSDFTKHIVLHALYVGDTRA